MKPIKTDGVVNESNLPHNGDRKKRFSGGSRGGRGERVDAALLSLLAVLRVPTSAHLAHRGGNLRGL